MDLVVGKKKVADTVKLLLKIQTVEARKTKQYLKLHMVHSNVFISFKLQGTFNYPTITVTAWKSTESLYFLMVYLYMVYLESYHRRESWKCTSKSLFLQGNLEIATNNENTRKILSLFGFAKCIHLDKQLAEIIRAKSTNKVHRPAPQRGWRTLSKGVVPW